MADIPRLNGAIKALESGKPAFVPFSSRRDQQRADHLQCAI